MLRSCKTPTPAVPPAVCPNCSARPTRPADVASYLLQGVKFRLVSGQGATNYSYYEGAWTNLPDFAKLKPAARGVIAAFDLAAARRGIDYALKFEAFLKIDREADYLFTLSSDDGSRLVIDGKTVVNNDGVHPMTTKKGRIRLSKGVHKITLGFFQGGGGAELEASIEAPGFGRHNLADFVAASPDAFDKKAKPNSDDPDAIEIKPALVEKGKGLFASLGCASCHTLREKSKPIASKRTAPALAKLKTEGGCLAVTPSKGVPVYGLDDLPAQGPRRGAQGPGDPARPSPRRSPRSTAMPATRATRWRPEEAATKLFPTLQPEMGDEGRVPPPLDGVGAKLNADYFKQILDKGAHDRPYMHTRMPGFGQANVGHLVEAFAGAGQAACRPGGDVQGADRQDQGHGPAPGRRAGVRLHQVPHLRRQQGRGRAGHRHDAACRNGSSATGSTPTSPTRRRSGPARACPPPSSTARASCRRSSTARPRSRSRPCGCTCSTAPRRRLPLGLGGSSIPLEPTTTAIIYRNFIEGAGNRAIGVGYPEKANLAFDANEVRLALLWQGAFIDAARHWTDRGEGFEGPLGDNVLRLHGGAAFAVLEQDRRRLADHGAAGAGLSLPRLPPDERRSADVPLLALVSSGVVKVRGLPQRGDSGQGRARCDER